MILSVAIENVYHAKIEISQVIANIDLFKINNRSTRKRCEIYSK